MPFSSEVLTLDVEGAVATLWLDRPDALNAFGPAFWSDLPQAVAAVEADAAVRAVVVAARGRAFTAGLDLRSMAGLLLGRDDHTSHAVQNGRIYREVRRMQAAITAVKACPKPVIAAVHGVCLGAGIDLITACDIRLAAADAVFSVRETKMAIVADLGTLQRLPAIVGPGMAAEMIYTGGDVEADRARRIGLVNDVYPDAEALYGAARALAEQIAANSPLVVQGAKAVLQHAEARSTAAGLDYVALWNAAFLHSDDLREAVDAFHQKRPPTFEGS